MDGNIDANELLDYIDFQIFPSLSRYEASICVGNNHEMVAWGSLDPLLPHSPKVKAFHTKGSDGTIKLVAPEDLNGGARWFNKSSLLRFLQIITSSHVLNSTTALRAEISQLEEAHSFHVSLYEKDGTATVTSHDSKNELLRAMYLRLTALREELCDAFAIEAVITFSKEEIKDIEMFCSLFDAADLRKSLCKLVRDAICEVKEDITQVSKQPNHSVHFGWSPAKLAQIERQNSSESGESSDSSTEKHPPIERSRTLIRSASPRRSASPMRRVQVGRSGSRRTTPLTIKSLNFIPKSQNDELQHAEQSVSKPPETSNSRVISVQDAISLFESKQKDQNSFSNASTKPVLRRWSTGLTGASGSDTSVDLPKNGSSEVRPDHEIVKNAEIETEQDRYSSSMGQIVDTTEPDGAPQSEPNDMNSESVGSNQKESASAEWSRQKEAELDELLTKMMETKIVKYRKDSNLNSKAGNEKIQSKQKDGKLVENKKQVVPDKRIQGGNKQNANVQKSMKTSTLRSSDKNNSSQEISKPSGFRKSSSKTSPLPATRKSSPSVQSTRSTGVSEIVSVSSSTTTTRQRKSQPAPTVTGSSSTKTQMKTKSPMKDKSKTANEVIRKNQQPSKTSPTSTKFRVRNTDAAKSPISGKPSLYSKVTKKSSVVPLEPKPFLRKGSKVTSGASISPISKKKMSPQVDVSTKEDLKDQILLPKGNDIVFSACNDPVDRLINSPDKSLNEWAENELTISISPAAWIDIQEHEDKTVNNDDISEVKLSTHDILPFTMPSPFIRQSLSQMLLEEETSESDLNEWGNADSPMTTTVFRKDEGSKGLKRLLKFGRKSKTTATDGNSSGWSSPSVFSEGEENDVVVGEESKSLGKRSSSDNLLLKLATLNNGHQRSFYHDTDLGLFGRSNMNKAISENSLSGKTKGTRPFFSLSAFRSSSK